MEELSHSRLVIQGFNQGGKRAIGMIHLELIIGELTSNVLFHVINAKTTYNMLLRRPWIHGNGIVPSTLHQCFKFLQSGIKKVNADLKPFAEIEAHFANAKFYVEDGTPNEILPVEIPSMESKQGEKEHVRFITGKDIPSPKESPEFGNDHSSESTRNSVRVEISTLSNNPLFLPYVPLSHRKKGQLPFAECLQSIADEKATYKAHDGGCSHIERKSCHAFNFIHKSFALEAPKWIREVFTKSDKAWYSTK